MTVTVPRNETSVPLADVLANRWSSRAFDANYEISAEDVYALGEAARWAPSAMNSQQRRFIFARRGTATFDAIADTLRHFNRDWAPRSSLLVVALAHGDEQGHPTRYAEYDLGQAVAHLNIEAVHRGLNVRQMGGFDADAVRTAFSLPNELVPMTVIAVGKHDPAAQLPEELLQRETLPRERLNLDEMAILLDI